MLRRLEKDVEDAVVDLMDEPGVQSDTRPGSPAPSPSTAQGAHSRTRPRSASNAPFSEHPTPGAVSPTQPELSAVQKQSIHSMNALPKLTKYMAYFPDVRNAHALLVCRDVQRFPSHRRGEGVLRHWVDHFEL